VKRLRSSQGYTLVEVLAVCMLLSIVLTGVVGVMVSGSHSELNLNKRFTAQNAGRTALSVFRNDAHIACSSAVNAGKTQVTFSIPIVDRTQNPPVAPNPPQQCGLASNANISKVIWCTQTSTSNSNRFALYRSTTGTCSTSSQLKADNLVNTASGFAGFFNTSNQITANQLPTITVDFPVSLKDGTTGNLYDLTETIAMRNAVWTGTSGGSCTAAAPCIPGGCSPSVAACYQPAIN
jgi:prepilin-type N-terminal cleavage/methylation domain-containing protein